MPCEFCDPRGWGPDRIGAGKPRPYNVLRCAQNLVFRFPQPLLSRGSCEPGRGRVPIAYPNPDDFDRGGLIWLQEIVLQCVSEITAKNTAKEYNPHSNPMQTHPKGSRARILLSSLFGPYAQDDEFGSRCSRAGSSSTLEVQEIGPVAAIPATASVAASPENCEQAPAHDNAADCHSGLRSLRGQMKDLGGIYAGYEATSA